MDSNKINRTKPRASCVTCKKPCRRLQPVRLKCGHIQCQPCLKQWQEYRAREDPSSGSGDFVCHLCQTTYTLPVEGADTLQTPDTKELENQQATIISNDLQTKLEDQMALLKDVTTRLAEERKNIECERTELEADINTRYSEGLRLLEEWQDACLASVKEAAEQAMDKIQAEQFMVQNLLTSWQNKKKESDQNAQNTASSDDQQPALMSASVLRHFQQKLSVKQQPPTLSYRWPESNTAVVDSLYTFLQAVSPWVAQFVDNPSTIKGEIRKDNMIPSFSNTGVEVTTLGFNLASVQESVQQLQKDNQQLQKDNQQLQKDNQQLQSYMASDDQQKSDMTTVQKSVSQCKQSQTETGLNTQMVKQHTPVFFFVQLKEWPKLDRVLGNAGGGYDIAKGKFIVPQTATYLFTASCLLRLVHHSGLSNVSRSGGFNIMIDGKPVASSQGTEGSTRTAHAVVRLDAGQRVWLQGEHIFNCEESYTSFCGVMIFPSE